MRKLLAAGGRLFPMEFRFGELPLRVFVGRYQDRERFLAFCRQCPRWGRCWACPPLDFDPAGYLASYGWITLAGARVFFDGETRAGTGTQEARAVAGEVLPRLKAALFGALELCETSVPGSLQLGSGGCHLCGRCARIDSEPCRFPDRMRYSLDSLGFDLTAAARDLLEIELLWSSGGLPEYLTLIHGLLSRDRAMAAVRAAVERGAF